MKMISCNLVLLPDMDVASTAVTLSKQLHRLGGEFALKRGTRSPHLTVYMFEMPADRLPRALAVVESLAARIRAFELDAVRYRTVDYGHGMVYADVEYRKTLRLRALQRAAVRELNMLRGFQKRSRWQLVPTEAANIAKYGFPKIGRFYKPHISFTCYKSQAPQAVRAVMRNVAQFDGRFATLALYEAGENGTCTRQLAAYRLRRQPSVLSLPRLRPVRLHG
jgi:hypothetical protein